MAGKSPLLGIGLAIAAAAALGAGWWGSLQYQRGHQLATSLDASTKQLTQLQARTSQLQTQVSDLQSQLAATKGQDAQLQNQLSQSEDQTSQLQGKVAQESKPDLPITVSYRRAVLGGGLVALIRNNSRQPLEVSAMFGNPDTGSGTRRDIVLAAQQIMQLGHIQGWTFAPGQRVLLYNAKYRPYQGVVPGA